MAMTTEELSIAIKADTTNLMSGLKAAGSGVTDFSKTISDIGKRLTVIGGAVTAAFGLMIKKTMDAGDQFDKMSLRTGESVENLSSLAYACDITGTSIEGLELGIKFLTRGMDDAQKGVGEAKDAFRELGISITDSEGNLRNTVDVLKEAATKIAAIENPAKQAALAMEIFGARSGTQLIPLLKEGGKGIEELMNKAKELGITMSTETATAAAEFKDRLTDLKGSLGAAGRDIAMILIPSLTKLAEKAVEIIKKIKEWAEAHKPLVEAIIKIGAILGVLAAVGGPILLAVNAFMKMQGAITALGTFSTGPIGLFIVAMSAIGIGANELTKHLRETTGGLRNFREEVNKMSLLQLDKEIQDLNDNMEQLQKRFFEIPKGIGQHIGTGQQEILTMIDEMNKRLDILHKRRKDITEISTGFDDLADSIGGVGTGLDKTNTAIDEFGNKIETFEEWVARLAEETKKANEKIADEAEKAMIRYEDAIKPIEDRLFELSHTEEEVAARNLLTKKEYLEAVIKNAGLTAKHEKEELTLVREWYNKEIELIKKKLEEQRDALIETANQTEESANVQKKAIEGIKKEYSELIKKIDEVGIAAEKAAKKAAAEKWLEEHPVTPEQKAYAKKRQAELIAGGYQTGTKYVPETGPYILHTGEEVRTKEQVRYGQQGFSNVFNFYNTVRDDSDIVKIRQQVEKVFEEFIRQYRRRGYELVY